MNYKKIATEVNNDLYKNMGKILLQAESISKIRRYGADAYFARLESTSNGYFTDFMGMFLYLSTMETILSDLDDTHVQ